MLIRRIIMTLLISIAAQTTIPLSVFGKDTPGITGFPDETKKDRDARMKWWRQARFGMFIHWGVYAVPAGTYQGQRIRGIGEWIMLRGRIPVAEYRDFAKKFNPVQYDPDAWVRLAKQAGMKYIVITSKHHDGFALYDSKVTDWDVVDATPYGKDLLRPLEEACKKHSIRLGFYYSQAQDWVHRGGAKADYEESGGWDEAHKGNFDEYLERIAYPQVKEILSGYDIDILWWDTPHWMNKGRADKFLPLLALRPDIVWNNRLGGGYRGDFGTPEQRIPDTGMDYDWETCMTMNNTWGFKSYDKDWKSSETLIHNLVDIVSKGGNYLLNVGPTKEGLIPEPSIQRLKDIGEWMKINGEAIYGTEASPFTKPEWGRYTTKKGKIFAHVFTWPKNSTLTVPAKDMKAPRAYLLADKNRSNLKIKRSEQGLLIQTPEDAPDPIASVIVIEHQE